MKFLKYSLITIMALFLIGGAGYLLAASGMKSKPGYVKLTMPSSSQADTTLALDLGPAGVKPLRWVINRIANNANAELDDSEKMLLAVLQDLQGVQLRIYQVEGNRQVFEQAIADSVQTLRLKGWQTLLKVREDDEHVVIMQTGDAGLIEGLSVLVSTEENAVFANLVGPLDPRSVALIADGLN